jgi:hypothetical protein
MKSKTIHSVLLAAAIGALSGAAMAADYKQNPFTLAYEGAISENVKGKVNIRTVTYKLGGIDISPPMSTPPRTTTQTRNIRPSWSPTPMVA